MANHILLQKVRLSASATSVNFANIPQTGYTDLKIVVNARGASTSAGNTQNFFNIRPNNSTSNYTYKRLYNDGGVVSSDSGSYQYLPSYLATSNSYGSTEIYVTNYSQNSYAKTISVESLFETAAVSVIAGIQSILWNDTSAITSINLTNVINSNGSASAFESGSTFSLYGVAATGTSPATAPKADGGNIISTDGTYWYHTFLSSGFFTPISSLTCDYLVVAGGGGGGCGLGYGSGGGGGAGGFRTGTSFSVSSQNYIVQVGAGGASGGTNTAAPGVSGTNSQFSTISSTGGGGGGPVMTGANFANGLPGGSGGGSATPSGIGGAGNLGSYSPVEGYAGGSVAGVASHGAGGGGSSQAGQSETSTVGGAGGNGTSNSYSGSSVTYAGGGGGGASGTGTSGGSGGSGGGGRGANGATDNAVSGTANLGGGGGGARVGTAGSGGSGIVIIRYAV